ncbi:MAG TPA: PQQ-binding-like beta-propeller repeat protein [Gammaproteobacteria bacterium]
MRNTGLPALSALALAMGLAAQAHGQANQDFEAVTDALIQNPSDGDWLSWRRTLNGWGFSPLDDINRRNVDELEQVWSAELGSGTMEPTPMVHNGVMYLPDPSDRIIAFDADSGFVLWEYERELPGTRRGGGADRTLAMWGQLIINASNDNAMYAVDALTGELVWETQVLDSDLPAHASGGPIVADGKVIQGRQCQPGATHEGCVITAHDAETGEELWRTRTIPRPGEPGDESWGDVPLEERWHVGSWMVPSYDPELELVYIGTTVTIPAPKFILGGIDKQHLYHNSTLALDVNTGEIVWYYQHVNDHWDLDHPFERILLDTAVAPDPDQVEWISPNIEPGEVRQVMTGIPGKTGVVYTLDRGTGEFLWARSTVRQNVIESIDGATGRVTENPLTVFTAAEQQRLVCPSASGGKNFQAGAYSPRTGLLYQPLQNTCMEATVGDGARDPSAVYGVSLNPIIVTPGAGENVGSVFAISVETGATEWKHDQRAGVLSMVATGGGLVFGGDAAGMFRAFNDETGEVLWEVDLESPVSGYPVTFETDGKQYVAVATGPSLVANSMNRLTPEIAPESSRPTLHVFALP